MVDRKFEFRLACALCGSSVDSLTEFRGHVESDHSYLLEEESESWWRNVKRFSRLALPLIAILAAGSAAITLRLASSHPYQYMIAFFVVFDILIAGLTVYFYRTGFLRKSSLEYILGSGLYRHLLEECVICHELVPSNAFEEHLDKMHHSELKYYHFARYAMNSFLILSSLVLLAGLQVVFISERLDQLKPFVLLMTFCAAGFFAFFVAYALLLLTHWENLTVHVPKALR